MSSERWPARVIVCGDRNWTDEHAIRCVLSRWSREPLGIAAVIHGDCRGADLIAAKVAAEMGIPVEPFPADWRQHGRAAGPIRNRQMLNEGRPALVFAFHDDIDGSRGTKDMVAAATAALGAENVVHYTGRKARRYRPSNGSEGECFRAQFCDRCVRDIADPGCTIYFRSWLNDREDDDYPDEWTYDSEGRGVCTEFEPLADLATPTDTEEASDGR